MNKAIKYRLYPSAEQSVTDFRCKYLSTVFDAPDKMIIDVIYASSCVSIIIFHTYSITYIAK